MLGVGGIAAGQAVTGAILLVSLAGSGWFMIWLGKGWDKPLDDSAELYKYGRPGQRRGGVGGGLVAVGRTAPARRSSR